jgi:hypothetical protein
MYVYCGLHSAESVQLSNEVSALATDDAPSGGFVRSAAEQPATAAMTAIAVMKCREVIMIVPFFAPSDAVIEEQGTCPLIVVMQGGSKDLLGRYAVLGCLGATSLRG